ncbi:hypothetical protein QN277_016879 [Acacia crassicarpa]|uniref:Transposase, Ptta/En/Spm, plant n=2 Tax=Acacia crassicarpa TaxID=499986 RepID=A0AAE1TC28_9FABA|nr:hypothetical protein QN277_016879 [Acacia crassicarpa]
MWIKPVAGKEFLPNKPVKKFLKDQMFRNFIHPWASWTEIPQADRDVWFKEFLGEFSWLPVDLVDLKRAYSFKASKLMSDRFYKLRVGVGKKNWIQDEVKAQLFERWATDEKFIKKREQNKLNRARMDGPSYAGGCIPFSEHKRKIADKGEVPADTIHWAAFEQTHPKEIEGEKCWINAKSQQCAETYQQLTQERDSQIENDPTSSYADNESLFIQAAGGFDKKGRVFGMGASAGELKSSMKRSSGSIGSVAPDDKRVKTLEAKVKEQEAQMKEQGKMILEMRELLNSLMKDKGTRLPPDGDGDADGDPAQTAAV